MMAYHRVSYAKQLCFVCFLFVCFYIIIIIIIIRARIWQKVSSGIQVHFMLLKFNQRTNGPVNAHLRPEIYTCTNKLALLD